MWSPEATKSPAAPNLHGAWKLTQDSVKRTKGSLAYHHST